MARKLGEAICDARGAGAEGGPGPGPHAGAGGENGMPAEVESVLLAHGLALVLQLPDGSARLVGAVTDRERQLWQLVMLTGSARAEQLPEDAGLSAAEAQELLDSLARRRLVRRDHDRFCPLGQVA